MGMHRSPALFSLGSPTPRDSRWGQLLPPVCFWAFHTYLLKGRLVIVISTQAWRTHQAGTACVTEPGSALALSRARRADCWMAKLGQRVTWIQSSSLGPVPWARHTRMHFGTHTPTHLSVHTHMHMHLHTPAPKHTHTCGHFCTHTPRLAHTNLHTPHPCTHLYTHLHTLPIHSTHIPHLHIHLPPLHTHLHTHTCTKPHYHTHTHSPLH